MNRFLSAALALPILTATAALPGCILAVAAVGAGIGYGAYSYVDGELEYDLPANPPQVTAAAAGALTDLQMPVVSSESTAVDGKVKGRTANDKAIEIRIKSRSDGVSHIGIRIGVFGDEGISARILDATKARLGIKPAPAPAAAAH